MTPTDFATAELSLWEEALRAQRQTEEELGEARKARRPKRVIELMPVLQALRTRADLLLAEAVSVKHAFRTRQFWRTDWSCTTKPDPHLTG